MTDFITRSREAAAQGDAFAAYRLMVSAVEADPGSADAWYGLGCTLHDFKKYAAAAAAFKRADMLRPGHHETLTNLGLNLGLVGRYEDACRALRSAIGVGPDKALGYLHLANVIYTLGDPMSTGCARRAVELDPESIMAHMILAFCLMTDGNWLEGFQEYEWRFKYKLPEFLSYPYPIWRGEETGTLVIVAEQGLGDSIQMMRYIPQAANFAERVVWLCQTEMLGLAQLVLGRLVEIIPMPAPIPSGDVFIPMMSLPVALGINSIEGSSPYVKVAGRWDLSLNLRVGLAWAGSPVHDNAKYRDADLEALLPLTEISGIDFYSLQIGPARSQIDEVGAHGLITDLSPRITNLLDTAREIARLDLVITVDTVVAHLAGAIGQECWLLVNQRARDWRWGRSAEHTDWYPSIRIFPRVIGDDTWKPVVNRMEKLLRDRVNG